MKQIRNSENESIECIVKNIYTAIIGSALEQQILAIHKFCIFDIVRVVFTPVH